MTKLLKFLRVKRSWVFRIIRALIAISVALIVLLAVAVGLLRSFYLQSPTHQAEIQRMVSSVVGVPTTVDAIDVRWRWRGPQLWLSNVVATPTGESARLTISRAQVTVDVWHWLRTRQWTVKHIVLQRPSTALRRSEDGQWWWSDRAMDSLWNRDAKLKRFMLDINDANLVVDDQLLKESWHLENINALVRRSSDRLSLEVDVTLPESLGQYLELSFDANRLGHDDGPSWQLLARGLGLELSEWERLRPALGATNDHQIDVAGAGDFVINIAGNDTTVEQWVVQSFVRDLKLMIAPLDSEVKTNVATAKAWESDIFSGQLSWQQRDLGWLFEVSDLELTRNGKPWLQPGRIRLSQHLENNRERQYDLSAAAIVVHDLGELFEALPVKLPASLAPLVGLTGEIRTLQSAWHQTTPTDAEKTSSSAIGGFQLEAQFNDFGLRASDRWIGVRGLAGSLVIGGEKAELTLQPTLSAVLDAPALFGVAPELGGLSGKIKWHATKDQEGASRGWIIETQDLVMKSPLADARLVARVTHPGGNAQPLVNGRVSIDRLDVGKFPSYLPINRMPAPLVAWLSQALLEGTASGELGLAGPVNTLPYGDEATFDARFDLQGVRFRPAKGWPIAENLSAQVVFDGRRISGNDIQASSFDVDFRDASFDIPNVRKAVVSIDIADTAGRLDNYQRYLLNSPLKESTGGHLAPLKIAGDGQMSVQIDFPVKNLLANLKTKAQLTVKNASMSRKAWPTGLNAINGRLNYDNGDWSSVDLSGRVLSQPFELTVLSVADASHLSGYSLPPSAHTNLHLSGTLADENWQTLYPGFAKLLQGRSLWHIDVIMPRFDDPQGLFQVGFQSDLEGLAVALPEPLTKSPDLAETWRMQLDFEDADRIRGRLTWSERLNAQFDWRDTDGQWLVHRGTISLGDSSARLRPFPGLVVEGEAPRVDVADWWPVLAGINSEVKTFGELKSVDLLSDQAQLLGWQLDDLRVQLDRGDTEWLIQLDSADLAGAVFLPYDIAPGTPITANLDRFYWRASGDQLSADFDPSILPAMRLEVQDFRFKDIQAGTLFAQLTPLGDGFKVVPFSTASGALEMHGEVSWQRQNGVDHSSINIQMKSTDAKRALRYLGFDPIIDAALADVRLNLHWQDSLRMKNLQELDGDISLSVYNGQLYELDPGAGKMLGLLSFASLPRRLSLDFSDVFEKGFGFDRIEGDFEINSGLAETKNLILEGPAGQLVMVGTADLVKREYDQTAVVQASVGSALPIAGAVAGGPVVGGALLIFSEIFKKPLQEASAITYRVTGPFDEPEIARVKAGTG